MPRTMTQGLKERYQAIRILQAKARAAREFWTERILEMYCRAQKTQGTCSRIFRSQYLGIGFEIAMCRCVVGTDEVTERKGWGRASCELDVVCRIRHNTQLVLATKDTIYRLL
jgi:hypothetical protein